jgi:hypothetical protein
MQQQIDNLQQQIDELKNQLSNVGMPIEMREIMRNEVVKDATEEIYEQAPINITAVPVVLTGIPALNDGTIIIKWRGAEYKIPYYV